jgi:hypothetical protein
MNWEESVERELKAGLIAEEQGNTGRARVCARRAVGSALTEWHRRKGTVAGNDVVKLLEQFLQEERVPEDVFKAGNRLRSRVRPDFSSPSEHPLDDARRIIDHLRGLLAGS